jgi:hypothetical protein
LSSLLIQSASIAQQASWQAACLETVQDWCRQEGIAYRLLGDEIFSLVPQEILEKIGNKLPIATDYARLCLLESALEEGFDRVIWLDADTLIWQKDFELDSLQPQAFGQEFWLQEDSGKMQIKSNVHNAVLVFQSDSVVLPFLRELVLRLLYRVSDNYLAPQFAGPKLLSALHSLYQFELLPHVGALSPLISSELAVGQWHGKAMAHYQKVKGELPPALNLCASLIDPQSAPNVIKTLLKANHCAI